jgi:hypothetical protein
VHEDGPDLGVRPADVGRSVGDEGDALAGLGVTQAAAQRRATGGDLERLDRVAEVVDTAFADALELVGGDGGDTESITDHGELLERMGVALVTSTAGGAAL